LVTYEIYNNFSGVSKVNEHNLNLSFKLNDLRNVDMFNKMVNDVLNTIVDANKNNFVYIKGINGDKTSVKVACNEEKELVGKIFREILNEKK